MPKKLFEPVELPLLDLNLRSEPRQQRQAAQMKHAGSAKMQRPQSNNGLTPQQLVPVPPGPTFQAAVDWFMSLTLRQIGNYSRTILSSIWNFLIRPRLYDLAGTVLSVWERLEPEGTHSEELDDYSRFQAGMETAGGAAHHRHPNPSVQLLPAEIVPAAQQTGVELAVDRPPVPPVPVVEGVELRNDRIRDAEEVTLQFINATNNEEIPPDIVAIMVALENEQRELIQRHQRFALNQTIEMLPQYQFPGDPDKSETISESSDDGNNNNNNDPECYICRAPFRPGEKVKVLNCSHQFHRVCATSWLKRKPQCPTCKEPVNLILLF